MRRYFISLVGKMSFLFPQRNRTRAISLPPLSPQQQSQQQQQPQPTQLQQQPQQQQQLPSSSSSSSSSSSKNEPIKKTQRYGRRKTKAVQIVYIGSILIWGLLLWALSLYTTDFVGYCILAIPVIVFAIGYFNASTLTVEVEEAVFSLNYLSIAVLIVLPILAWVNKDFGGDKRFLVRIMIVAII